MNTCYCDGYGICFGGQQKFADYMKKQDDRNDKWTQLDEFNKRADKAKEEGKDAGFTDAEKLTMELLRKTILEMDQELDKLRDDARKRGDDPKFRKEEMETYDSTHIWDYAPHGDKI